MEQALEGICGGYFNVKIAKIRILLFINGEDYYEHIMKYEQ